MDLVGDVEVVTEELDGAVGARASAKKRSGTLSVRRAPTNAVSTTPTASAVSSVSITNEPQRRRHSAANVIVSAHITRLATASRAPPRPEPRPPCNDQRRDECSRHDNEQHAAGPGGMVVDTEPVDDREPDEPPDEQAAWDTDDCAREHRGVRLPAHRSPKVARSEPSTRTTA